MVSDYTVRPALMMSTLHIEQQMNEMIAYCGLDCHECGAYLATKSDDDEKRKEVAELWSKEFGADITSQDINCDGCTTVSDIHFSHCFVCEIRLCGIKKAVINCAYCNDYGCNKLKELFEMAPEAQTRLNEIRGGM